jgi:hypothetical protein
MVDDWAKFKKWEASAPSRFDPAKSTAGSDYNLHHAMVEATANEIKELLSNSIPDKAFVPVKNWVKRTPTSGDKERGALVAAVLEERRAHRVLIRAATAGYVTELVCQMTECFCPSGVAFFDVCNPLRLGPWIPTHEHYPNAAHERGTDRLDNVVLAHRRCNNVGHKLEALQEFLRQTPTPHGNPLDPRAIEIAMRDNVAERRTRLGVYPRRRGSWKRAKEVATKAHQDLLA